MDIYNKLNQEISNTPIDGAYNITNFNGDIEPAEILHELLSLKNISVSDVDDGHWSATYDSIRYALDDPSLGNTHSVLSFWLDD